ncbi:hypothetical protein CAC42_4933 [Sphaceloma murrayae]|uniref:Uncharacterized protein n=1 Tax=Sphaceloma murrayae TaxID=2082308 RepID=A0A2K1QPU9_9PEZI|nr:hypothetical protein CAC42_4933 [Sphaceloma murrayae]
MQEGPSTTTARSILCHEKRWSADVGLCRWIIFNQDGTGLLFGSRQISVDVQMDFTWKGLDSALDRALHDPSGHEPTGHEPNSGPLNEQRRQTLIDTVRNNGGHVNPTSLLLGQGHWDWLEKDIDQEAARGLGYGTPQGLTMAREDRPGRDERIPLGSSPDSLPVVVFYPAGTLPTDKSEQLARSRSRKPELLAEFKLEMSLNVIGPPHVQLNGRDVGIRRPSPGPFNGRDPGPRVLAVRLERGLFTPPINTTGAPPDNYELRLVFETSPYLTRQDWHMEDSDYWEHKVFVAHHSEVPWEPEKH